MNCPLMFISVVDDRGESLEAPARELTDELSDGAVRGGRRGRTLVSWQRTRETRLRGEKQLCSTSSRSSMGVFCGDEVVVGLKMVPVEFVDEVRLPAGED